MTIFQPLTEELFVIFLKLLGGVGQKGIPWEKSRNEKKK